MGESRLNGGSKPDRKVVTIPCRVTASLQTDYIINAITPSGESFTSIVVTGFLLGWHNLTQKKTCFTRTKEK